MFNLGWPASGHVADLADGPTAEGVRSTTGSGRKDRGATVTRGIWRAGADAIIVVR